MEISKGDSLLNARSSGTVRTLASVLTLDQARIRAVPNERGSGFVLAYVFGPDEQPFVFDGTGRIVYGRRSDAVGFIFHKSNG